MDLFAIQREIDSLRLRLSHLEAQKHRIEAERWRQFNQERMADINSTQSRTILGSARNHREAPQLAEHQPGAT